MCLGAEYAWVPAVISAVASAGAGAAGTYSAAKGQKMEIEERHKALQADQQRQAQLQQEADARLRGEVAKFAPESAQQQVDVAAATRAAAMTPQAAPAQYQAAPTAAPVEVKTDASRRLGTAVTKAQEEAKRRAHLAAYGDVSQQQGFQLNRLGENFRRLGAESRGSTNVMGVESQLPSTGAQGWRNRSDIANTLGQIGALYSIYGGGSKPPAERTDRIW